MFDSQQIMTVIITQDATDAKKRSNSSPTFYVVARHIDPWYATISFGSRKPDAGPHLLLLNVLLPGFRF